MNSHKLESNRQRHISHGNNFHGTHSEGQEKENTASIRNTSPADVRTNIDRVHHRNNELLDDDKNDDGGDTGSRVMTPSSFSVLRDVEMKQMSIGGAPFVGGSHHSSSADYSSVGKDWEDRYDASKSKFHTSVSPLFGRRRKDAHRDIEFYIRVFNRLNRSTQRLLVLFVMFCLSFVGAIIYGFSSDRSSAICLFSLLTALFALAFSLWLLAWVLKFDEGTQEMRDIANPIKEGSEGFFAVQYGTITRISISFAILLVFVYLMRYNSDDSGHKEGAIEYWQLAIVTGITFLCGAFCSALSGYSGMWVSVRTNVRVASAARRCYNQALQLCFRGGAFSSVINVALAVGGVSLMILALSTIFPSVPLTQLPLLMVGFGFGASLVAMFAQLGGGIYTKGADVGADLVGKIEQGIPEDDPRNPAVIADLVGDNVGDCAGQCADLFESIAAEVISAMILGGALAESANMPSQCASGFVLFPLAVHCMDLVLSSFGVLFVGTKPGLPDLDTASGAAGDPLKIMIRVYLYICVIGIMCFAALCRWLLYFEPYPYAWAYFASCGGIGMICAFLFVIITQYYTDYEYSKVKRIAEASMTGPATNIIAGLSVGMESTALPVLCIGVAVVASYRLGCAAIPSPEASHMAGLFGTAVATMGMLCTAVFVLSMSSFGPIADNAGGIVEMSSQPEHVRAITDRLDAVGNVTKANTKGFSVGSASLACFLLFSAFMDEVTVYGSEPFSVVDLAIPEVWIGGLIGSMTVFVFSSWSMEAVGRSAQRVVKEVRRQFREHPGIMEYRELPDYHTCVAIVSRSALREMSKPGLLAVFMPIAVGLVFRVIGSYTGNSLLSASVVASFMMFSTTTGILMALFLNNGGGAWDNAKKYIETGALGGKGSDTHKAAVVGDTVGDPCKDTAGPSVHVLIKLISTVTMVLTPVFVSSAGRSSDGTS